MLYSSKINVSGSDGEEEKDGRERGCLTPTLKQREVSTEKAQQLCQEYRMESLIVGTNVLPSFEK